MTTRPERDAAHLTALAQELGVQIVERQGRHRAGYHDGCREIRVNPGLPQRVHRSFLAHEIAHALFRDTPSPHAHVSAKQERRAWEWAATYLIDPEDFAETESVREGHLPSMAYDLGVTVEVVSAFRDALQRIGDTVYLQPKLGAGMWTHRQVVR